jgi:ATP-dependent protease Clp ATPase subunit
MMDTGEATEGETMTIPVCSFCKRPGPKVSYLVQGPDNLLICDNCVAASVDTVAKKDRGWRDRQIDHLLSLRNAEGPKTT